MINATKDTINYPFKTFTKAQDTEIQYKERYHEFRNLEYKSEWHDQLDDEELHTV